jgi:hypothetical protein
MAIFDWNYDTPVDQAVFEALGAASTCWERLDLAGVFDGTRAKDIGNELLEFLRQKQIGLVDRLEDVSVSKILAENPGIDEAKVRASVKRTMPRYE